MQERETATTADPVRQLIVNGISSGTFRDGAKLPTERELADTFGLTRGAVRKALTLLETEGVIVRHTGRGTFVSLEEVEAAGHEAEATELDSSPAQLIEARLVLEPALVAVVVKNATLGDLKAIARRHEECCAAETMPRFHQLDRFVHLAIGQATHNDLLIGAIRQLDRARDNLEWHTLKGVRHKQNPDRRADVEREHAAIVEALLARDEEEARQAMTQHLLKIRLNLLKY